MIVPKFFRDLRRVYHYLRTGKDPYRTQQEERTELIMKRAEMRQFQELNGWHDRDWNDRNANC